MKNKILQGGLIASFLLTTGCATIVKGSDQTILFDTDPTGAICSIMRDGETLYESFATPLSLSIEKDKDHLMITCNKDGYKEKIVNTDSEFEGMAFGNLIFGGIIGVGIDAASGAMNKYPTQIILPLERN